MLEKIETFLKNFISAFQIAKIYTTTHPKFSESADTAFGDLDDILRKKDELILGIVGEELAYETEIFFELSKKLRSMILYLKARGIERISFCRGLDKQEFIKFLSLLSEQSVNFEKNPQNLSLLGIKNISVGKITASPSGGVPRQGAGQEPKEAAGPFKKYEDSLDRITDSVDFILGQEDVDYLQLRFNIVNVMENLMTRYSDFLKLTAIKKYDVSTFMHLLNVCVLAMYFSSRLGFSKDDVVDIGIAALFHDIGKVDISRKIIGKESRLSDEEFALMKSHSYLGAEILLRYTDSLGFLPVVVAFEHHARYDSTGYPKLFFSYKPHLVSSLVTLCDVYDALGQRRSYKRDYAPKLIYETMLKEQGGLFEPKLFDEFFKVMGVWPIGALVALSDGRVAVVRDENGDDIFSPIVETIVLADKKEIINLKERKGALEISRFLNPLTEGKPYLHLT
jgi:HD-GYP domain-containing protein (c-di-GMP phosphodiesterase class II)